MAKQHIKRGDEVVVISGVEAGKRGKVLMVEPRKAKALVEGINIIKIHHQKKQKAPNDKPWVEREGALHVSKLMKAEAFDARAARRAGANAGKPQA